MVTMLKKVVVIVCTLGLGILLGSLLVGHQAFLKKTFGSQSGEGALSRARRSVVKLLSDGYETESTGGAAVYTIWGRTQCPGEAERVYKGIIGSGSTANSGSSSEYVCLPDVPEWGKFIVGASALGSTLFGTEFKQGDGLFNMENVNGDRLLNQNAVCAVCHIRKEVQLMIPGKKSCPLGWHREYYGYLMSSKHAAAQQRNNICVDIAPEADRSGAVAEGGAALYLVEAWCNGNALPCPNYVHVHRRKR